MLSFLIYTEAKGICFQELSFGVFINVAHNGLIWANRILIENLRFKKKDIASEAQQEIRQNIIRFLNKSELRIEDIPHHNFEGLGRYLKDMHKSWFRSQELLPLLKGNFHLFYLGNNENNQPCLCCRPVKISFDGIKCSAEREIWMEKRKHIYRVKLPNSRNLLLSSVKTDLLDSEILFLRRTSPAWERFCGYIFTIGSGEKPRLTKAFLYRSDESLPIEDYMIPFDGEIVKKMCENKDFRAHFEFP